eukprot:TRINITY_DN11423_c0_g1_i1.p1 TRINITY_DN11423_c0_g1~~TRINITY_DN11423_c0_g1_i1.p1  ORF type:complete len:802 (-),score=120.51 TRINITY_DN11423_c0_g1_i1:489-2894(-)
MGCGLVKTQKYGQEPACPQDDSQQDEDAKSKSEAEVKAEAEELARMSREDEAAKCMRDEEVATAARKAAQLALVKPLLEPVLNYVMLVMGQTGSGKTSLINLLGSLDLAFPDGRLPLELIRKFAEHTVCDKSLEFASDDAMASKTSDAQTYSVKIGNVSFTIIDTPGFGDSRGMEADEKHVKLILNCLEKVGEVNCVLLTINGREARLNATLKYVLSMLTSVMPSRVLENIAVLFTNTDNERKLNFKMAELERMGLMSPPFVCLENPLSELDRALQNGDDLDETLVSEAQVSVQKALATIASFFGKVKSFDPVPTVHFKEVYEKREEIEAILSNAHEKYQEAEAKSQEVSRIKEDIIRTGRVEPQTVERIEWRLQPCDKTSYVCHHPDCHSNCTPAFPVSMVSMLRVELDTMTKCTKCGHRLGAHKVSKNHWQSLKKKVTVNLGEIEKAENEKEKKELAIRALEDQIEQLQKEKDKISAMLFDKLDEYSRLGIPDAYKRLLQGQLAYVKQLVEAKPDDIKLLEIQTMLEHHIEEFETSPWRSPKGARQKLAELVEFVRPPPPSWNWKGGAGDLQPQRIRVPEMDAVMLQLLRDTASAKHLTGCSGQDGSSKWLQSMKSVKVWRLEHPVLWQQFATTSTIMKQQLRAHGLHCPAVDPPIAHHPTLDATVNETYLWHGTKAGILPTIREWGMDERVCSLEGLHGGGLYFASESCKAGQYALADGHKNYLFYTRVILGIPYYIKTDRKGERRPPPYPDIPGRLFDSVIANEGVANAGKQYHREFVIYDRRQTYPEFEVEVTTGK